MEKAVTYFSDQIVGIRWGIVTSGLVDTIKVLYHGQPTPIKHLAHTTKQDNRISVTPHEPMLVGSIEKALKAAGLNAYTFSKTMVVVSTPPPSGEERQRVISHVRKLAEEAKVAVRNIRKKTKQKFPPLSKSELQKMEKQLQELTDQYVAEITKLADNKISAMGG